MAPKAPPAKAKKVKKVLTEEEKKAKADFEALKAEEMRKKAIRDRRAAFKQAMIDEEKRSQKSMLQIHKDWRKIMRTAKIEEQRRDMDWLAKKHVHQVEIKDHFIYLYRKQMYESEAQHRSAQIKHLSMLDALIDLHYLRTMKMEEEFQEQLKGLEGSFMTERNLMTSTHDKQKKELKDMLAAMKAEAEEAISERRQIFEATREELKNKNIEEYNMLRLSLEGGIEDLERRIEHTHQRYLTSTEAKTISFKNLVAKDLITARVIEQRMRKLIKLHEELALWRGRIVTKGKEWDMTNTNVRVEKETLLGHYINLKRLLDRIQQHEHSHLKEVSRHVLEATNTLMDKFVAAQRVLVMAKYVSKLETEHEKIFPFDPLHCSTIPTVPGMNLERELADDECKRPRRREMSLGWECPSQLPAIFLPSPKRHQ
ncbi:hypothetical protein M758_4G153200 [Ceratodon purpureus]|uniref:Dynein regulatory complex subunit 2 n=1 Tax=Ceratodon purpureus TaxID=3225 RepID=A0A8T0I9V1_CERPU|nr:hypothetical protein KC19_4G152500 [Ceratodon purpureus]KAG0619627.1 hypothetical protein M758_4G153200 [Ceratodon purpureus]